MPTKNTTAQCFLNPKRKPPKSKTPIWAVEIKWSEPNNRWAYVDVHGSYKDEKAAFMKGHSGNPKGTSSEVAKTIQLVRSAAVDAVLNVGLPRVIDLLSNNKDLSVRELVNLITLLSDLGIPKQTEEVNDPKPTHIPQIIISQESIDRAIKLDKLYTSKEEYEEFEHD